MVIWFWTLWNRINSLKVNKKNKRWVRVVREEEDPIPWRFASCVCAALPSTSNLPSASTPPTSSPARTSSTTPPPIPPLSPPPPTPIPTTATASSSATSPTPWASPASSFSLSLSGIPLPNSLQFLIIQFNCSLIDIATPNLHCRAIYLGETFCSYISINNSSNFEVRDVIIKVTHKPLSISPTTTTPLLILRKP